MYSNTPTQCRGFSLIEVILATSLFLIVVGTLTTTLLYGEESTMLAGNRIRAVMLAEEGIEAVRAIRDQNFANLTDGTYGLSIVGGIWTLAGASDTIGIYTREIVITTIDPNRRHVAATITWQQNAQRTGSLTLESELTNWSAITTNPLCIDQANHLDVDSSAAVINTGKKQLDGIALSNTNPLCDIIITNVSVFWGSLSPSINRVRIGNTNVWAGLASTGDDLDIEDVPLANIDGPINSLYRFDGKVEGYTFDITYTMSDGTTKIETGISP